MVTKTEARNYLSQVGTAQIKSVRLSTDLVELKTTSKKLIASYQLKAGQTSKKIDTSDLLENIELKQEQLQEAMQIWLKKRQEISNFINSLPVSENVCSVLFMHYVSLKPFKIIAKELNYSYGHVIKNLHQEGLEIAALHL